MKSKVNVSPWEKMGPILASKLDQFDWSLYWFYRAPQVQGSQFICTILLFIVMSAQMHSYQKRGAGYTGLESSESNSQIYYHNVGTCSPKFDLLPVLHIKNLPNTSVPNWPTTWLNARGHSCLLFDCLKEQLSTLIINHAELFRSSGS